MTYQREYTSDNGSSGTRLSRQPEMTEEDKDKENAAAMAPAVAQRSALCDAVARSPSKPMRDPASTLLQMQRTVGNRRVQDVIQTRLEVSQPGDVHEREAEHFADRVMAAPEPAMASPSVAGDEHQRRIDRASSGEPEANLHPDAEHAVHAASNSAGEPLPAKLQRKFGDALNADLGGVRIHTGSQSVEAARAINARAYTTGGNIHFNQGQYDPHSAAGQHLLAHELAHTVQQGGSPVLQTKPGERGNTDE
ncbi:hypothetical protein AWB78_02098 [Caballeronia calidae]|uniref:eCIS core domain-containing protein n=1 Tax=Caballeronia calidae TaxID=1777139 RepID=A0A158AYK6_9BURK|nr:DUF4157 domain-containing protein [Caballeronia calidae]SAK62934.1 hypothetical protein AWB78_02098 [Caballeronia calidae]